MTILHGNENKFNDMERKTHPPYLKKKKFALKIFYINVSYKWGNNFFFFFLFSFFSVPRAASI